MITTNFISIFPDWNSLDSVRRVHTDLEGTALVFFALLVVAEAISHSTEVDRKKRLFDTFGICFFAIAVVCEIAGFKYGERNDELSARVISSLDQIATKADKSAKDALILAKSARGEADTFEANIVSAQRQAANAESHLADALERANAAQRESIRLRDVLGGWQLDAKSVERFTKNVQGFPGTSFVLAVNPTEAAFMEQLDGILSSPSVGWNRRPPPFQGDVKIAVDDKASVVLSSGILIEVDSDQIGALKPAVIALGTALKDTLGLQTVALHLVPQGSWGRAIHIVIGKRN